MCVLRRTICLHRKEVVEYKFHRITKADKFRLIYLAPTWKWECSKMKKSVYHFYSTHTQKINLQANRRLCEMAYQLYFLHIVLWQC